MSDDYLNDLYDYEDTNALDAEETYVDDTDDSNFNYVDADEIGNDSNDTNPFPSDDAYHDMYNELMNDESLSSDQKDFLALQMQNEYNENVDNDSSSTDDPDVKVLTR